MSVIALGLAMNPALVSLHHVVRILLTVGFMSLAEKGMKLDAKGVERLKKRQAVENEKAVAKYEAVMAKEAAEAAME